MVTVISSTENPDIVYLVYNKLMHFCTFSLYHFKDLQPKSN